MIRRVANFEWLVSFGPYQQHVIGTRHSANQTLNELKDRWRAEIKQLPWYLRIFESLNLKFLQALSA